MSFPIRRSAWLVLCCLAATGCDAPHDNPLDPSLGGNIDGRILTRRATPIAGAEIAVPAADRFARADTDGRFIIRNLPEDSLWLHITASGYARESACVSTLKGRVDTLTRYLNGLPVLSSGNTTTHVWGRSWPPDPLLFCRFSARATDRDGDADIDSVWVEVPDIGYSKRLAFDPDSQLFTATLWSTAIPSQNLETLVGQPVVFSCADKEGTMVSDSAPGVSRIIYDLPTTVFPAVSDTVTDDTAIVWHRFDYEFWVRYQGEIVRIEGGGPAGVVSTFATGGPADTTWRLDASLLQTGDYFWTIEAIDAFGNSSRSEEELFHAR